MLMFPAWMEHGVEESKSSEERISIAFNITLMAHEGQGNNHPKAQSPQY